LPTSSSPSSARPSRRCRTEAKKEDLTQDYPQEPFLAFAKRFALSVIGAQALDKSSAETDEIEKELAEALGQVDQDDMLDRLLQGIDEDEVAVDAREIKHLFNGDEKKARLFIDRICSLGGLAKVDPPPSSVKELDRFDKMIENVETIVDALEEQMTNMDPRLLSMLYPADYIWVDETDPEPETDPAATEEDGDTDGGSKPLQKKLTKQEKRASAVMKVHDSAPKRKGPRPANSVFPVPPEKGELTRVCHQMAGAMRMQDNKAVQRSIDDLEDMGLPRGQAIDEFWTRPVVNHM